MIVKQKNKYISGRVSGLAFMFSQASYLMLEATSYPIVSTAMKIIVIISSVLMFSSHFTPYHDTLLRLLGLKHINYYYTVDPVSNCELNKHQMKLIYVRQ